MSNVAAIAQPPLPQEKLSTQMHAVLLILSADAYLWDSVGPFIDLRNDSINWTEIRKIGFGSGHKAATFFAYSVWTDEVPEGINPFEMALSMSPALQRGCLQALALRWGLKS